MSVEQIEATIEAMPVNERRKFARDYLETLDWNRTPPGPKLPATVAAKTSAKYLKAYEKLAGRKL